MKKPNINMTMKKSNTKLQELFDNKQRILFSLGGNNEIQSYNHNKNILINILVFRLKRYVAHPPCA